MSARCRHNRSWLICGGRVEWCYRCGALRRLMPTGPASCAPAGRWTRPTGPNGDNPFDYYDRALTDTKG